MTHLYDIAVLGSTPAGCAAALRLARHKLDVVLLDVPSPVAECPLADWAPADLFKRAGMPKGLAAACGAVPFRHVRYHHARLDKFVEHDSRKTAGMLVRYDRIRDVLKHAAAEAGVKFRSTRTPPTIHLEEDQVRLVGTAQAVARVLIVACSRPGDVMADLSLPSRSVPQSLVVAGLDVPMSKAPEGSTGVLNIVELPERSELGMFFCLEDTVHMRVISHSLAAGTRASELSAMVSNLQSAGVLPGELHLGRARGAVWHPPAGVALELETHVAKRCLLAGTAGGFAEAVTGQTLRPTIFSALLAADAAAAALKSDDVQNKLGEFKNAWREELGDILRPPGASLRLLLPLLFVNQTILGKFTQALLYGESI